MFIEVGAPTYKGYTLGAILNIYNFAEDPILRKKAGMILDLDFADYAQQNYNGILGGAKSRSYPNDSPDGNLDSITSLGNLLFGSASSIAADNHVLTLATSGYSPPPVVQIDGHGPRRARELRLRVAAARRRRDRFRRQRQLARRHRSERPRLRVRHPRLRVGAPPS